MMCGHPFFQTFINHGWVLLVIPHPLHHHPSFRGYEVMNLFSVQLGVCMVRWTQKIITILHFSIQTKFKNFGDIIREVLVVKMCN